MRKRLFWICLLVAASTTALAQDAPDEVRVRLLEAAAPQALIVSAEDGGVRFYAGEGPDNVLAELAPREEAAIGLRGDELYVKTSQVAFFALSLRLVPDGDALLKVQWTEGGAAPAARRYAGRLTLGVDPTGAAALQVFNHVALEDYVAAVVSREYGFDDLEGARAMAVLARTYALRTLEQGDELSDTFLSQQYDGADPVTPAAREAARLTQGEVLTYRGALVEAVYFSSSGGHTADNEAVWDGVPLPYLRGVPDPYDGASPHAAWRSTVPRGPLLRALSDAYGFDVEGFHLGARSRDGRVAAIKLLQGDRPRRTIGSNAFRLLVNRHFGTGSLRSTLFDARREGDRYVFTGRGFGHGVGMSQYGALEMSRRGHGYRDILAFYFTDVRVQRLGEASGQPWVTQAPARLPEQRPDASSKRRRVGW